MCHFCKHIYNCRSLFLFVLVMLFVAVPCYVESVCECVCVASFAYTSIFAQQMVLSLSCFAWCVPASLADTEGERLLCFFLNLHPNMCPAVTHLPTVFLSITWNGLYVVSALNVNTSQMIEDLFWLVCIFSLLSDDWGPFLVGLFIYTTVKWLRTSSGWFVYLHYSEMFIIVHLALTLTTKHNIEVILYDWRINLLISAQKSVLHSFVNFIYFISEIYYNILFHMYLISENVCMYVYKYIHLWHIKDRIRPLLLSCYLAPHQNSCTNPDWLGDMTQVWTLDRKIGSRHTSSEPIFSKIASSSTHTHIPTTTYDLFIFYYISTPIWHCFCCLYISNYISNNRFYLHT